MLKNIDPIKLSSELIKCKSLTPFSEGAIDILISYLEPLGFVCKKLNFGDGNEKVENLYARWGNIQPNICFAGHVDVVPIGDLKSWSCDPFGGEIKNGSLWGRGSEDMKSAIASFISAVASFLKDNKHFSKKGSISFLITSDEEGKALNGTKKVVEWLKNNSEIINGCLVGEPTNSKNIGDTIKIGRRGSFSGSLIVKGIQGHVGYPQLADNPINKLIKMLEPLSKVYLDEGTKDFQPSSAMITTIDVNNEATNIIPEKAFSKFNIRFNTLQSIDSLQLMLKNHFDMITNSYEFDFFCNAEPFLTQNIPLTSNLEKAIKKIVNIIPIQSTSGGTSDARFITKIAPVIEFGLIGKTMHKINENVLLNDITILTNIYNQFLTNYFGEAKRD